MITNLKIDEKLLREALALSNHATGNLLVEDTTWKVAE